MGASFFVSRILYTKQNNLFSPPDSEIKVSISRTLSAITRFPSPFVKKI